MPWVLIFVLVIIIVFLLYKKSVLHNRYKLNKSQLYHAELKLSQSEDIINSLKARETELQKKLRKSVKSLYLSLGFSESACQNLIENYDEEELLFSLSSNLTAIPYLARIATDINMEYLNAESRRKHITHEKSRSLSDLIKESGRDMEKLKEEKYKLDFILTLFPYIKDFLDKSYSDGLKKEMEDYIASQPKNKPFNLNSFLCDRRTKNLEVENFRLCQEVAEQKHLRLKYVRKAQETTEEIISFLKQINPSFNIPKTVVWRSRIVGLETMKTYFINTVSNITALPYMARLAADYETIDLYKLEKSLDWGNSQERAKKVKDIRKLRIETKEYLEQYKIYEYQLSYLLNLFPDLADVLDTDYRSLPSSLSISDVEHEAVRDYLSQEEYNALPSSARNQLALDRYLDSHRKSNWQIGRDYENYIGYELESREFDVSYVGSLMKKEDLGRDLIAKKNGHVYVVQCKYWSATKTIHEKHIAQLYGTVVTYCIENNLTLGKDVTGMVVTNIDYSEMAKKFANMLGIQLYSSVPLGSFPMIKCNIGRNEHGETTRVYHLPFDQQYDSVIIDRRKGELTALTIREAESLGFRRAHKWHGE